MRAIVGFLIEAHGTKCEETLLNSSRPSGSDPCSNAPLRSFGRTLGPKRWLLDLRSVADVHAEQWPLWGRFGRRRLASQRRECARNQPFRSLLINGGKPTPCNDRRLQRWCDVTLRRGPRRSEVRPQRLGR